MIRILRVLGWPVAAAVSIYFIWFVFRTVGAQDFSSLASLPAMAAIFLAALLYATIIPVSAWAWMLLLERQGETWSPGHLAAVMGATQAAKYIPGNVAQHIGRASLALGHGMRLQTFTVTVVHETLLAVAASIVVGVVLLWVDSGGLMPLPDQYQYALVLLAGGFAFAAVVVAMGPARVLPAIARLPRLARLLDGLGRPLGMKTTLIVFSAYCVNYLLIGLGMWVVARTLGVDERAGYALLTAAFTLAWLLGFLTPGAPAGLGVREGILALLLAGAVSDQRLLALILAMRMATLVGDGLCFLSGMLGLRKIGWRFK